jgi:hypothetical protein
LSVEDEAAVEAELEAMMMDMQGQTVDLPEVPATTPLPTAPTNKLPVTATAEKDEGRVAVAS